MSGAAPARSGGPSPQASPSPGGLRPQGAVFPVAGYTGKVDLHHGHQEAVGGSDLFAPEGTPVVAMVPGKVQWASHDPLGGHNVGIVGDDGLTYYYAHFKNAPRVKAGDAGGGRHPDRGRGAQRERREHAAPPAPRIGRGIQTGAGAQGGLGRAFDAVSYLRQTLSGAAPAARDAPGVGRLTSPRPADAPSWWSLVE